MNRVCSVCAQDNYSVWFRPPRSPGPIVQCRECDFVYVNPVETIESLIQEGPVLYDRSPQLLESSNLDDIAGSWEQKIIEDYMREMPAKQLNAQAALAHIGDLVESPGTLLDIGCFCGVFLSVATQVGWDCYGVEPLVMPAVYARGRFGLRVITDTLHDDTFPPEFFDVVTAFQVFEHLIDPEGETAKIWRLLKPGGLLAIEVPNIDTPMVKLLRTKHRHFVKDHVSFFSGETIVYLLKRLGFRLKKIYYPSRVLSLRQIIAWIGRYNHSIKGFLEQATPCSLLERTVRVNLRDIVTVITEKEK